jgi:hypothetical protein
MTVGRCLPQLGYESRLSLREFRYRSILDYLGTALAHARLLSTQPTRGKAAPTHRNCDSAEDLGPSNAALALPQHPGLTAGCRKTNRSVGRD